MKKATRQYSFESINDVHHLGAKLGKGAYAKVKLVKHVVTGEILALKIIDLSDSKLFDQDYEQIELECRVHKQLNHPNIIKYLSILI